jgi:hypothetical protein
MENMIRAAGLAFAAFALVAQAQTKPAAPAIARLEKRGAATQLIVDGKPFLVLSGELANTASSNSEHMKVVWPTLANQAHLNTVLTGVSWDWIEPEEGKYDSRFVDEAITNAQRYNVRIVWIYFASWKNGISSFAPVWVKANQERFPRVQIRNGKTIEALSTLSENNVQADARVFAALMRHLREVDKTRRSIMVQVENEVGILGDARDRSPLAEAAVPRTTCTTSGAQAPRRLTCFVPTFTCRTSTRLSTGTAAPATRSTFPNRLGTCAAPATLSTPSGSAMASDTRSLASIPSRAARPDPTRRSPGLRSRRLRRFRSR